MKLLKNGKWHYIEDKLPGCKSLLEDICLILELSGTNTRIGQNKMKKKDYVIYKYHIMICGSNDIYKKITTIYINSDNNYKIKLIGRNQRFNESKTVDFSTLDELREILVRFVGNEY